MEYKDLSEIECPYCKKEGLYTASTLNDCGAKDNTPFIIPCDVCGTNFVAIVTLIANIRTAKIGEWIENG